MSEAVQETAQQQGQVQKPKIITIFNHKGGVGKTTLAFNLGIALAKFHNKRVLLVDFDPQANLTALALSRPGFPKLVSAARVDSLCRSGAAP
jgi:cellulose biosynthesis protein BcsQ